MPSLRRHLSALLVRDDGAIGVVTAITLPILLLILGLVLDITNGYVTRSQLQSTADASVLAAALSLGQDDATVRTNAQFIADQNMPSTTYGTVVADGDVQTGNWNSTTRVFTPGLGQRNAVQVVARQSSNNSNALTTYFAELIGINSLDVNANAIAGFRGGGLCFLTLKNTPPQNVNDFGVRFTGSANVDLACGIGANLNSPSAVRQNGSPTVNASTVTAVGGITGTYNDATLLQPNSVTQVDPYANVNAPASNTFPSAGCKKTLSKQADALSYAAMFGASANFRCFGAISISSGTVTLQPAVYVIDGGDIKISGNASLICNGGCTFVLTNHSSAANANIGTVSISGNTTVDLVAPTTGPYKRLVFYQDRRFTLGKNVDISGGSGSTIQGAFYFPTALLNYTGSSTATTDCFQAIAWQIDFTGTTNVSDTCPAGFGDLGNKLVKLVA